MFDYYVYLKVQAQMHAKPRHEIKVDICYLDTFTL